MGKKDMDILEKEINTYEDNLKYTESNITRVEQKLCGSHVDEEQWKNISNQKAENETLLDNKTRMIAGEQKEIGNMERDLEEVKRLNKEIKEIEHVRGLLDELEKMVSANKFVDFVSMNQLKYIAIESSRRLRDITSGRYALELDSNGEFVMRDDFNGGVRRAVDTLSGGETFLTSLCLAIALSSHIQLKGSAPLEFFFLDEGFGTLDSELLETVMTSLEKLHSDKLCVGLISHVDELKNRVPVKLIVTPAKPGVGGTKVEIEYS